MTILAIILAGSTAFGLIVARWFGGLARHHRESFGRWVDTLDGGHA